MRPEDQRTLALLLLACAAVATAGDALAWVLGAPLVWIVVVALAAAFCVTMALLLIISARRLERRLMDRIDQ